MLKYDSVVSLLKDKETPASVFLAIVFCEYGAECLNWESQVLRLEILSDFGVELSASQSDKLQAAITIMSTDACENDWQVFNNCIHALNGEPFEHDELYPIDAEQVAAAMPEIEMIRKNFLEEGFKFSDEVNTYIGLIFFEYGLFLAPNIFPTADMPPLSGDHNSDSQAEKKEALNELYTAKKEKIKEYMACFEHTLKV